MGEYKDRSIATIQHDVEKQFDKIEKKNGIWIRDDLEIAQAGIKTCWAYIHAIKSDKSINYGEWALSPLRDLQTKLQTEINAMTDAKLFTNNKDQIYQIANRIDNAEREVLKRLGLNNTNRDSRELVKKSEKEHNGKNIFIMEWGSNLTKQTGNLIFTKESNPVKIHDALKGLFKDPNQVYQIDYSKCTNAKIKAIMSKLSGTETCYLRYDSEQKTYTICDKDGNRLRNRVYIWEGIRLIPDGIRQWRAYAEEKKNKEYLSKNSSIDKNNLIKELEKAMPSTKELSVTDRKKLARETDKRLWYLLAQAKKLWYEIHNEPISKLQLSSWLMELHLISGSSERDEKIWTNNTVLGEKIYDFLDGNEGEYKTYLTQRVHALRQKLDPLTKVTKINVEWPVNNKEKLDKWNLLYWIEIFKTTVDNFRASEGDSRLDDDDKYLTKMKQILQNAEASIKDAENLSKDTIVKNIINPLWSEWVKFKNIGKTISDGNWKMRNNPVYATHYNYLKNIFLGAKDQQIHSLRQLWNLNRVFDKTETSHLGDEIAKHADQIDLKTNNQNINKCLDTIKSKLSAQIDNNGNYINTKFLDRAYSAATNGRDTLMSWLAQNKMIPTSWINTSLDKDTLKSFDDLCSKLNQQKKLAENPPETLQSLKEKQHAEKIKLEQKGSKSEDDRKRLQALDFLEKHPEEQKRINQATLDSLKKELKYGGLVELTNSCLLKPFVENWWGAKGKNADVYNDIIGYGLWDLSDENAKIAGEIIVEIAITVAIAVATGGMWGAIVAGMLRGLATGARAARWVKLANTIRKVVTIWQRSYKALNWTGRATKLWLQASGLLLEGTAFNAASNMVHSAMHGTSLDTLNLNPLAKENIKTAAFLGVLSVSNQLAHTVWKVWASTRIGINLQKGLETAKLTAPTARWGQVASELWAMIAAEQAINLTFGHDVIDPETWEVKTERSLHAPTQQDLIQMIGMILAFKMVKPALWHRIEQKMNNGTLEICRSVNPKEVLVRDRVSQKVVPLQEYIDSQYNNYKTTPEQYKLRNHNQWLEKQSKHESEIRNAQELIIENTNLLNSSAMTTLREAKDIVNLSPNDIKRIQREIWLTWKEVDGVFGPKSREVLSHYLETLKTAPEAQPTSKEQLSENTQIKKELQQLGIEINEYNIKDLSEIAPEQITKVVQIKEELQQLGVEIYDWNIKDLSEIAPEQITKVVQIKEELQQLGVKIHYLDIKDLSKITPEQISKVIQIKEGLQQLGVKIYDWNIKDLSEITPEQISKVVQIKEGLQQLGVEIYSWNIKDLSKITPSLLKELIKHDVRISSEELILASQLIWDYNIDTIKGLLERKTKYLEKYQTLSDKRFDELFRKIDNPLGWKKSFYEQFIEMMNNLLIKLKLKEAQNWRSLQYGKNGIAEIKQTTLGYCYAYTGFNLLKRSNFFEVMIKTSIRETAEWWEVTVPFWSRNGKIIKVWKQEIHDSYRVLDEETWTYQFKKSKTTSETSTWMKVLEIAFIKEYILEHNYLGDQKAESKETRAIYKQAIEWARESFKKTGDFKLNGELLWAVEWGRTGDFLNRMIWENVVKSTFLKQESDLSKKDALFNFINNGTLKIKVGSNKNNPHLKVDWNFTIKDISGKSLTLTINHAYALERVYITKTWEKVAVISNPRNTHEKIHVSRNDAMTKFHARDVSYISPQRLFTE